MNSEEDKMTAKEMFQKMGWSYEYVKGDCSEDVIQCKDLTRTILLQKDMMKWNLQFNLISKVVVVQNITFINEDLLKAINKQAEELGWLRCEKN